MKKKIKSLTLSEVRDICAKHCKKDCTKCPLSLETQYYYGCLADPTEPYATNELLEKEIKVNNEQHN